MHGATETTRRLAAHAHGHFALYNSDSSAFILFPPQKNLCSFPPSASTRKLLFCVEGFSPLRRSLRSRVCAVSMPADLVGASVRFLLWPSNNRMRILLSGGGCTLQLPQLCAIPQRRQSPGCWDNSPSACVKRVKGAQTLGFSYIGDKSSSGILFGS